MRKRDPSRPPAVAVEMRPRAVPYMRRQQQARRTARSGRRVSPRGGRELCEEIALIRAGHLIARDTAEGLRAAYGATSLTDVYVKAMAA